MDQNSCPNCEYERGSSGRPVAQGEHIHCLDCGASWKDISANVRQLLVDNSREKIISDLRSRLRNNDHASANANQAEYSPKSTIDIPNDTPVNYKSSAAAIAVLMLVGIGGMLAYLFNGSTEPASARQIVSLSDIKFKEQIGRAGKKVITVRGLVQNSTNKHQAMRPISIILRRKDGGEIIRWRHISNKPVLKAGGKSRFASSIQYDTPVIAYAEAVFE